MNDTLTHDRLDVLSMSLSDMITALSGGHRGALLVCNMLFERATQIDPDHCLGNIAPLLYLDTMRIYGENIYKMFGSVCEGRITNMIGLLRAVQLGHLSIVTLNQAIDGSMFAVDVGAELAFVRKTLSNFANVA